MLSKFKKSAITVGIDLDTNSAKVVVLAKLKQGFRLEAWACCQAKTTTLALQQALEKIPFKIRVATIAMPYSAVFMKTIALDALLQEHQILHYLKMHMEKYTGVATQNLNLDFAVLGPNSNNAQQQDIKFIAAKKEPITTKLQIIENFNIKVNAVDVTALALVRAVRFSIIAAEQVVALLHFTANGLLLAVLTKEQTLYLKEESSTQQIQQELQLFLSSHHIAVDTIILAGEVTDREELIKLLSEHMRCPIVIANSFSNIECAPAIDMEKLNDISPKLLLGYGLALRNHNEF